MEITITIPSDFETEYEANRFRETFDRVIGELNYHIETEGYSVVGKYELETLEMLREQFDYHAVTGDVIPIEWLHSIMKKQMIFAMESEMEGTTTVQDGVIHCVSGALACQVLANVINLWEKENDR